MKTMFTLLAVMLAHTCLAKENYEQILLDARVNAMNFGDLETKANARAFKLNDAEFMDAEHAMLPRYSRRNSSVPLISNLGQTIQLVHPETVVHAVQHFAKVELMHVKDERNYLSDGSGKTDDLCDEHLKPNEYKQVKLFVYIDQCPTRTENNTISGWANDIRKFLYSRYQLATEVKLLFPEVCYKEEDGNKYDDLDAGFQTDANHINVAINLFRGGPLRKKHSKTIKGIEQKHSIFNCFEFYMCHSRENCVPETEVNHAYIESMEQIVGYSRLYLVRQFVCNHVKNSVPIEYYEGDELRCACRCPPGHEKNDQDQCVAIENQCKCKWLQQCYKYEVKSEWDSRVCQIKNWYGNAALVPIPFPHDNYVSFKENAGDSSNKFKGPHIELQVNDAVQKYTWQYYQQNRESIFNGIQISSAGKYHLTLRAFDYGPVPETCSTTLIVEDKNPPTAINACPTKSVFGDMESKHIAKFSEENLDKANNLAVEFKEWVDSRANDGCGNNPKDHSCDIVDYEEFNFNADSYTTNSTCLSNPSKCFQLSRADTVWMRQYIGQIADNTKLPGEPKFCKKCVKLNHRFGENLTPYYCGGDDGNVQCQLGDSCGVEQCLVADGKDFFTSDVKITDGLRENTAKIIKEFPNEGYNNVNQIHYSMDSICTSEYDNANCQIRQPIKTMFDIVSEFATSSTRQDVFGGVGSARQYIQWRFKIEGDDEWSWKAYKSSRDVVFDQFRTAVVFEGWTACGKIAEEVMFVYLHLHTTLDIDGPFGDDMFYQSSRYKTNRADDEMCNFPLTDFAEVTFDFKPSAIFKQDGDSAQLQYTFTALDCTVQYEDAAAVPVIQNYTSNGHFLERYALELPSPTRFQTNVLWSCRFSYKDYHGNAKSAVSQKRFKIMDCDPPGIDCPWGECQETCPSNLRRPNTVCDGNHLVWNQAKGKTEFNTSRHECCKSCSSKTTCASIFPGIEQDTIHYCEYIDEHTVVAIQAESLLAMESVDENKVEGRALLLGGVMVACVLFAIAGVFIHQRPRTSEQRHEEGYQPLLL